jgi:hypothetical protein
MLYYIFLVAEEKVLLFLRPMVALGANQVVQFDHRAMEVLPKFAFRVDCGE